MSIQTGKLTYKFRVNQCNKITPVQHFDTNLYTNWNLLCSLRWSAARVLTWHELQTLSCGCVVNIFDNTGITQCRSRYYDTKRSTRVLCKTKRLLFGLLMPLNSIGVHTSITIPLASRFMGRYHHQMHTIEVGILCCFRCCWCCMLTGTTEWPTESLTDSMLSETATRPPI
jgi:hypothetical protein